LAETVPEPNRDPIFPRGISTDTALRLSRYFGTSAEFWLNLQASYDLSKARNEIGKEILNEIQPLNLEAVGA
jgi:plasmid maintenance system antidote protein VapI